MSMTARERRVIAGTRAVRGMVSDRCVIMTVRVTGLRLMPRMTVMYGRLCVLMGMHHRGSSRQSGPGGEEHHGHESHDLPDKSQPHVSISFVPAKRVKRLHRFPGICGR